MSIFHTLKQWGLWAFLFVYGAVLETKAAIGAFHAQTEVISGWQHSALSAICALLAFCFASVAGAMRHDERPHVRQQALVAQILSICFLLVPVTYLASSLKQDRLTGEWEAYTASPAYAADQALVADPMADRYEREGAQERLVPAANGELSVFDGEFYIACFFQLVLITAAGIRLAPPATEAEVKHWRSVAAGKKAAATRKRNAAKRKTRKTFRLIAGGKN